MRFCLSKSAFLILLLPTCHFPHSAINMHEVQLCIFFTINILYCFQHTKRNKGHFLQVIIRQLYEDSLSLSLRFNGRFPGEPGLAGVFIEAKDDGCGGDNWTTVAISHAKLHSNHHHQQTNIQFFYRPDALPVAQPTVSKHWRETVIQRLEANNVYAYLINSVDACWTYSMHWSRTRLLPCSSKNISVLSTE